MKHEISHNRNKLTVTIDAHEQAELKERIEDLKHAPEDRPYIPIEDVLEPLVCNSDLDWIDPTETGDLTEAPMLGTRDNDEDGQTGPTGQGVVLERWAFMDYQVTDPVLELAETGRLIFTN